MLYEEESSPIDGSGSEKVFPSEHVVAVIGEHNTQYYPTLMQLVLADAAYAKQNGECVFGVKCGYKQMHLSSSARPCTNQYLYNVPIQRLLLALRMWSMGEIWRT